jgi:eukaryotic-like serine/threonine-protein kinase
MGIQSKDRLGPYRVGERLGQGGMGQVFAAVDEGTGLPVAIKVLLQEAADDRSILARFLQEGRALTMLRHPGIVEVLACHESEDGTPYLVIELLTGRSLRAWLGELPSGKTTAEQACALGVEIAEAMIAVHRAGIVHRDLKPENIMIMPSSGQSSPALRIKIFDFGIAKVPPVPDAPGTQVLTDDSRFMGTHRYMAPEQYRDAASATDKADVYSFGALLFEMITGKPPFDADEEIEILERQSREEPPSLRALVPEASTALEILISAMLSRAPAERPTMLRCAELLRKINDHDHDHGACPLPGLQPFTGDQAELFFGRRDDRDELVRHLELGSGGKARWVALEGPSGSGKSSLIQAGVLPALEKTGAPEGMMWRIACLRPAPSPLLALGRALLDALAESGPNQSLEQIVDALRSDEDALHALTAHVPPHHTLVLVVEQLEELFSLDDEERAIFDTLLARELVRPGSRLCLLTTLRSDFLHRLDRAPGLGRLLNQASRHYLGAMSDEDLERVIHGMASRAGMPLSAGLARRILRDTASTDCRLPLLGHALRALWSPRDSTSASLERRYDAMGGVGGALAGHAGRLLDALSREERERAKWMILALIQVGKDVPDTRRSRTRRELLAAAGGDLSLAERVLDRLAGARGDVEEHDSSALRLLVIDDERGKISGQQRVDLIHETLLQQVPRIKKWLDEERARLACYHDLEEAARVWEQTGRGQDALASGALLHHFRGYTKKETRPGERDRMISERARRFLERSEEHDRKIHLFKQARRGIAAVALAMLAGVATYAHQKNSYAEAREHELLKIRDQIISDLDWKLARIPGTRSIRYPILTEQHQSSHVLEKQEPNNGEVLLIAIKSDHRLGDFELLDGTLAGAEECYEEARQQIDTASPGIFTLEEREEQRALNLSKLGKVALARKNFSDARTRFEAALNALIRLREDDANAIRTLATSYEEMADLDLAQGHLKDAEARYDEAIKRFETISDIDDYNKTLLAEARCARGRTARLLGDRAMAERQLADARSVLPNRLVDTYGRLVLASIYHEQGALKEATKPVEALALYQSSSRLGEMLHAEDPTRKPFMLILAASLRGIEATETDPRERDKAKLQRQTVIGDFERLDPKDPRLRDLLGDEQK